LAMNKILFFVDIFTMLVRKSELFFEIMCESTDFSLILVDLHIVIIQPALS
jgi:hypothetical protein